VPWAIDVCARQRRPATRDQGNGRAGVTRLRVWCENRGFRTMAAVLLTFAAAGPSGGTGKLTIAVQA
jgi:hypothetical protein